MTLRNLILPALLLLAPGLAGAAPPGWAKLLTPTELAAMLTQAPDIRVLHIDGDFDRGHIPGAVDAPLAAVTGPSTNPGAIPPLPTLTDAVQRWGINAQTPVVIVHTGSDAANFGRAARMYWTLQTLGVEHLAILNGGLTAWVEARLPLTTERTCIARSDFTPSPNGASRVATAELKAMLDTPGQVRPLDARPPGFFGGLARNPSATRPGTVAGANNLPFTVWFEDNRMVDPARARAIAEANGLVQGEPVVAFCNAGILAAASWFALSELAGVEGTRLYPSSVIEWSQLDGPMDNVPGRVTWYWQMFSNWLTGLFA